MVKLSILVPIFNEEELLDGCLWSLSRQMEKGDELICIIDKRTRDNSLHISRRYTLQVLITESGKLTQRDTGIRVASNNVIVAVDADCTYPYGFLSDIRTIMADPSYVAASGWYHWPAPQFIRRWWHSRRLSGSGSAFRRSAYVDLGGFNLNINQQSHRAMGWEEEREFYRRMKALGGIGWIRTGAYNHRLVIPHLARFMGSRIEA